jgi:hypothetical protein
MFRLRIAAKQANEILEAIANEAFQEGRASRWSVANDGGVSAQSVCWLFCWGKRDHQPLTAESVRNAIDQFFEFTFDDFDALVPLDFARWARYRKPNVDSHLAAYLDGTVLDAIEGAEARIQGFQTNPRIRKAIEDYAMNVAIDHYKSLKYVVDNRSKNRPYDLECTGDEGSLFVEVKGTQSTGEAVFLTANEVKFARSHPDGMVLFLVSNVQVREEGDRVIVSGGNVRILDPWDADDPNGRFWPIAYRYELPEVRRVGPAIEQPQGEPQMTIYPYLQGTTWVFDDERTGLQAEAFVLGASEMISRIVQAKAIPNAAQGFAMTFGDEPFDGFDVELILIGSDSAIVAPDEQLQGDWYLGVVADQEMTCWLCPALLLYFTTAPQRLYVRAEPLPPGVSPIWNAPADRQRRFVSAPQPPQT